jgi:hypothetical protein
MWLLQLAIGGVWLYEGLYCKLLNGDPRQMEVVEAAPFGKKIGWVFLKTLGVVEVAIAIWAFSGAAPLAAAIVQTALLVTLNANGLLWSRHIIHDPGGMVVKNFAFLVLVWVAASPLEAP